MFETLETELENAYRLSIQYRNTPFYVRTTFIRESFGYFLNGNHVFQGEVIVDVIL